MEFKIYMIIARLIIELSDTKCILASLIMSFPYPGCNVHYCIQHTQLVCHDTIYEEGLKHKYCNFLFMISIIVIEYIMYTEAL